MKLLRLIAAMLVAVAAGGAHADTFPSKPIKLFVPYPPGGGTDILARHIATGMSKNLGQQVIVENRGGANGLLAGQAVAKAAPDGYTLLVVENSFTVNPSLLKNYPLSPTRDFTAISPMGTAPLILVVSPAVKANSLKELVAYAKANPGTLTYGSAGNGNPTHIIPEMMKLATGTDIMQIPYKGSGPAITDLVGGQLSMMVTGISAVKGYVQDGRLKPVAVTGQKRSTVLPNVPTFTQSGVPLPEVDLGTWWGIVGPADLPKEIVAALNQSIKKVTEDAEVRGKLAGLNIEVMSDSPDGFAKLIANEVNHYADLVKRANIAAN